VFEKQNTYFPIKTDTVCQLKWTWSSLWLTEGTTSSCHKCFKVPLDKNNFDSFHNLPHKIKEREIMLQGKWPTIKNGGSGHCKVCKDIEDNGGMSDRLHHLTIPNHTPKELLTNPLATSVTPQILEVYLNSTCNLKCTYCTTKDSSQWQAEVEKYGPLTSIDGKIIQGYDKKFNHPDTRFFFEKTLDWIKRHGNGLKRLHLLGGETFYQKELQEVLDILKTLKNPHLELNIVSNLMVKEDTYKNYIEQIKRLCKNRQIGRFDLTCSIDNWGAQAEYARFGLKLDLWEKLFAYTVNQEWIYLNINQTITSLTMNTMIDLIKVINSYRKIRKINQHVGLVVGRPWMHPKIYGYKFWSNTITGILSEMPEDSEKNIVTKKYLTGIFKSIPDLEPDLKQISTLKFFLDGLDKRRNTNWRKIFPYLDI
jgi:organic radical activating enzyme